MNMLLIACALVATSAALVAFVSFTRALRCADEAAEALRAAERAAAKLNAMAGRVVALEGAHESLLKQHRKLSGRFYAITAPPDLNDLHDAQEVRGIPDSRPPPGIAVLRELRAGSARRAALPRSRLCVRLLHRDAGTPGGVPQRIVAEDQQRTA